MDEECHTEANAGRDSNATEEDLGARKLRLEVEALEATTGLQREKLAEEILDMRRSSRRSRLALLVSAATPILVGFLSVYVAIKTQTYSQEQHDADSFARLVQQLGSMSAPARAGAVVGLSNFVKGSEYAPQTTTILITQLAAEDDPRVLRVLIPSIASIGPPALAQVVRENRKATFDFVRASRRYVAVGMPRPEHFRSVPLRRRLDVARLIAYERYSELDEDLQSVVDPTLATRWEVAELQDAVIRLHILTSYDTARTADENAFSRAFRFIAAGEDGTFDWLSMAFESKPPWTTGPQQSFGTTQHIKADAMKSARSLFVTSLVIERVLAGRSEPFGYLDWRGVALLAANLDGVSFADADLSDAFIEGTARDADFTGATLSRARLHLDLRRSKLAYTALDYATLPDISDGSNSDLAAADLTGANWWDASGFNNGAPFAMGFESDGVVCIYKGYSDAALQRLERGRSPIHDGSSTRTFIPYVGYVFDKRRLAADRAILQREFPRDVNEKKRRTRSRETAEKASPDDRSYTYDVASSDCSDRLLR
ncbi:MAG TPA: hypothetical protein VK669_15045 [Candidatus Limnocylindrales bacterium]|nr:hypothetical protein [Candidatus Limnocylindrales bacterium]